MRRSTPWLLALLAAPTTALAQTDEPLVLLSEIVADPQTDWNQDGRITASDEYVELNAGPRDADLTGWTLRIADTTPANTTLAGVLAAGAYRIVQNPNGDTNNDAHVLLVDPHGHVRDELRYGAWPQATAPTANANGVLDESLRRLDAWTRGPATPMRPNDALGWRQATNHTPAGGWAAPNTTYWFQATTLADATNPLQRLELRQDNQTLHAITAVDAQILSANHTLRLGTQNTTLTWRAERTSGYEEQHITIQVDGTPPHLHVLQPVLWRNASTTAIRAVTATDTGIGGIQYQYSLQQNMTEWNSSSLLNVTGDDVDVRARARDAYHNTSPWSEFQVRIDAQPPRIHEFAITAGQLRWRASDNESGLAGFQLLRRTGATTTQIHLGPMQAHYNDTTNQDAQTIHYELRAIDHAGNPSTPALQSHTPDAARPQVKQVRFSRTTWTQGNVEIRIDFDRQMDPQTSPLIDFSPYLPTTTARYLANHTTYYVLMQGPPPAWETQLVLHVRQATSIDGATMARTTRASLPIDAAAPLLLASLASGTTRANHLTLSAEDASSTTITWKLYRMGDPKPRQQGQNQTHASLIFPEDGDWRVKATATDSVGHRSPELTLTLTVDRTPPSIEAGTPRPDGVIELRVQDTLSGVDWFSANLSQPDWLLAIDAQKKRIQVQATPQHAQAILRIQDHAGNEAQFQLRAVIAAPASAPLAPQESYALDETLQEPRPAGNAHWWLSALLFVGGIAAAVPVRRVHARRRRRRSSFARRLRAVLAETAPNKAVKDASTA